MPTKLGREIGFEDGRKRTTIGPSRTPKEDAMVAIVSGRRRGGARETFGIGPVIHEPKG
jgi:hypothetical protein